MKRRYLPLTIITLSIIAAGCGGGNNAAEKTDYLKANTPAEEAAVELFKNNCIQCHGGNLEGRMGVKTNLQKVGDRLDSGQISNTITNGRGLMPSFKGDLSEDEIGQIADWLESKK